MSLQIRLECEPCDTRMVEMGEIFSTDPIKRTDGKAVEQKVRHFECPRCGKDRFYNLHLEEL